MVGNSYIIDFFTFNLIGNSYISFQIIEEIILRDNIKKLAV